MPSLRDREGKPLKLQKRGSFTWQEIDVDSDAKPGASTTTKCPLCSSMGVRHSSTTWTNRSSKLATGNFPLRKLAPDNITTALAASTSSCFPSITIFPNALCYNPTRTESLLTDRADLFMTLCSKAAGEIPARSLWSIPPVIAASPLPSTKNSWSRSLAAWSRLDLRRARSSPSSFRIRGSLALPIMRRRWPGASQRC